ncbi:Protein FIZZY-RELATED 2 [Tetrabaena socialis]|uniref:Protein FIZZY-RELATED 2 n=1 Tax=Tetrabaena socialis TaxID=47790 RepID=A0A2J7ZPZ1_9CHLO|nr:Protein FIZZY-RELATED 2 [Tetrabaena socialis]|eukprot:PNH02329.1 Protein FIZZY-RELATED 2 [Tetrabaena socialis]
MMRSRGGGQWFALTPPGQCGGPCGALRADGGGAGGAGGPAWRGWGRRPGVARWSPDDRQLASGGNDNQLYIWSLGATTPTLKFSDHTAAVKVGRARAAKACGAGHAGKVEAIQKGRDGAPESETEPSRGGGRASSAALPPQLYVGYDCHTLRVLYLAVSPDGQTIVTGAGDETLRFWSVFPSAKSAGPDTSVASMNRTTIR